MHVLRSRDLNSTHCSPREYRSIWVSRTKRWLAQQKVHFFSLVSVRSRHVSDPKKNPFVQFSIVEKGGWRRERKEKPEQDKIDLT